MLHRMTDWLTALEPYAGVGLAFALGLLIGVERGWTHRAEPDGSRVAGIRTFSLLGLTGGLAGVVTAHISPVIGAALLIAAAAALLIGYMRAAERGELSATTTVVGVMTLGLGLLAAMGQMVMASVIAAVAMLLLVQRRRLHDWIESLSEPEVLAIARFALIALAVLPLLPDGQFGPLGAWNPRQIWMVVVLVSGLSLVAYAASRKLGASKGVLATAAAGAIVSSTAVTAALAARLRKGEDGEAGLVAGIALASAIMFARVMVLVGLLAPFALPALAAVAAPAGLVSLAFCVRAWRARPEEAAVAAEAPAARNPFDIGPALFLAGLVMVMSLAGRWALQAFGDAGLATVLGLSGMVDVDAAIITMSALPKGVLTAQTAGFVLAAPILTNSLVKAGLAFAIARGRGGGRAAAPLLASVAAGLAGVALLPLLFGR
jgi:uncharacterized membrane protein (DUF4010 family)